MRHGTSRALTADSVRWYRAAPRGAGVAFRMPSRPRVQTGMERDVDGARRRETTIVGEARFGYFAVFVAEWEAGIVGHPLQAVAQSASAIFERAELRRERSRRLAVDGYYAREDIGTEEHGAFVALRQFVGDDRVVLALAIVPQHRDALAIAERFMGSISLDSANALFPPSGSRRAGGEWTPVYIPEAEFGIAMPSAPSIDERELSVDGSPRPLRSFESRDRWGRYRVRVVELGDRVPDGAFEEVRQRLGFDRDVRPVQTSGFPGRVYVTDRGDQRSWVRMFRTAGRIYVVEAIGARRSVRDRSVARALMRYFDSFRIL